MNIEDMTNEQLIDKEKEIFEKWAFTGKVCLAEYADVVRELTLREEDPK